MRISAFLLIAIGLFQFSFGQSESGPDTTGWQSAPTSSVGEVQQMMGQGATEGGTIIGLPLSSNFMSFSVTSNPHGFPLIQQSFKTTPTPVVAGNTADNITSEIEALARGLQYDPLTIYNWVKNHIDYECYYGSKKGAHLTLMEMGGNDYDQASLMIALLRVSGYSASYAAGPVGFTYDYVCASTGLDDPYGDLSDADFAAKISTPENPVSATDPNLDVKRKELGVGGFFITRGFPRIDSNEGSVFVISHVWVRFTFEGQQLNISPSIKTYSRVAAPSLVPTGMNKAALLTAAAATVDTIDGKKWVRNIQYTNLSNLLSTYTDQLLTNIKSGYDGVSMNDLLGKPKIIQDYHQDLSSITQIYSVSSEWAGLETWNGPAIPVERMSRIDFIGGDLPAGNGVVNYVSSKPLYERSFTMAELAGRKLSLTYGGDNYDTAYFSLDDSVDSTFQLFADLINLKVSIFHPHYSIVRNTEGQLERSTMVRNGTAQITRYSSGINQFSYPGNTVPFCYAIISAFENPRKLLRKRLEILEALRKSGVPDTDNRVRTELLYAMGLDWFDQTWRYSQFSSARNGMLPIYHNRLGTVAQQGSYYIDVAQQLYSVDNKQLNLEKTLAFGGMQGLVHSAMEHAVVNQNVGRPLAVSTTEMLWRANNAGEQIYRMTSSSWDAEKSNLSNYSSADTAFLNGKFALTGTAGLLPKTGNRLVNNWRGVGYAVVTADQLFSMKISGGLNGGFSTVPGPLPSAALLSYLRSMPAYDSSASNVINVPITPHTTPKQVSIDPVDMLSGAFLFDKNELSVERMSFVRRYNSHLRNNDLSGLGNGWTHDHDIRLSERSSTLAALGETNSYQAAATYISALAMEMVYDTSNARDWTLAALIARWAADRTFYKAVGITFGNKTIEFVQLPNGSFLPPPGTNYTLSKTGGSIPTATSSGVLGIYTMTERNGKTYLFNSKGRISKITDPNGNVQQFNYNGSDQLTTITDGFNHTFTYSWSAGKINSVSDGTGRSVSFIYVSGNLTSVTDVAGSSWTYHYDSSNRLEWIKDPALRTVVENTYDGSNRVATQRSMGNANKTWCYAWTGFRNLEENPDGNITGFNYDARGRSIGTTDALGNTISFVYDGQDRMTSIFSPKQEIIQRVWNSDNNLVSETDPESRNTNFSYDSLKRLSSIVDKRGKETTFTWSTAHQMATKTDPLGHVTTWTYFPNGNLQTLKDAENKTSTFAYDTWGFLNKVTFPDNKFQSFTNNARGDTLTITDAAGRTITNAPNARGQILTTTLPAITGESAAVYINTYDNSGNLESSTDANANETTFTWDALSKNITTKLPALPIVGANIITQTYDLSGSLASSSNSLLHTVTYGYDAAKRLVTASDPLNRVSEVAYDENSQAISGKDPLHRITSYGWNERGEITSETDPMDKSSNSEFDPNGNLTYFTDRRGKIYSFGHDDAGRLISSTTPGNRETTITYFNNDLVKTITEPSLQSTTFAYDNQWRIQSQTDPTGIITKTYDGSGLPLTVTEGSAVITRTYDERGRLKSFTNADGDVIQYKYDGNGNLSRLTYPDNKQVNYTYNSRNLLSTVTDWANRVTTYQYDKLGRLTGIQRPNGTAAAYIHDSAGQLQEIKETTGSNVFSYLRLHYDAAGQINKRFYAPVAMNGWQHPSTTAEYDNDNRLISLNGQGITNDADSNITQGSISQGSGNVTLSYNSRNLLTAAGAINYTYDAEGRRRTSTSSNETTRYVIDPNAVMSRTLVKHAPDGSKTFYVYGLGLLYEADQGGSTKTYHFDQVGSTIARTDSTGQIIGRAEYSAYGLVVSKSGNMDTPFLYNGQFGVMTDANGLLHMRARYYSPYLMRFINADPIGFGGGSNWFAYADGNPVSNLDPFGLWSWTQTWGVAKLAGGAVEIVAGAAIGGATAWTGVGAVGGGLVALHGIDVFSAGLSQAITGQETDTFTSKGLQALGASRNAANIADTAISVVGSGGGGAVRGVQAAGAPARGLEFSHWIPDRALKAVSNGWIRNGFGRSVFNGNYVSKVTHALSDPYRYRFMSAAWKELNPPANALVQQLMRIPQVYKWAGAGAAASTLGRIGDIISDQPNTLAPVK